MHSTDNAVKDNSVNLVMKTLGKENNSVKKII